LIQEWRRRAPLRQPERQKERFRKQQVKVISCQRPLLLLLYEALAQPKQTAYRVRRRYTGKPLQIQ